MAKGGGSKRGAAAAAATDAAKGKKTVAGTSASAALKKGSGDWAKSTIKDAHLVKFREQGYLPPAEQLAVRAPSPKEVLPEPRANERVCFAEFLPRGFSLPLHDFVRGLLFAYGVQIHDLTPNGIMHIACFITLCECFLGVAPSWALWKAIFMVRPNRGGGRTYPVGGCGIQVRSDTRYFRLKTVDSAQGWRKGWFYATVEQDAAAPFSTAAFTRTKAWDHQLSAEEMEEASPLLARIGGMLDKVTGIHLIATFVKRRVWPIRARAHPMWEYEGAGDITRMNPEELSRSELLMHVRHITNLTTGDTCNVDCPVAPYGLENPLLEVCMCYSLLAMKSLPLACSAICDF